VRYASGVVFLILPLFFAVVGGFGGTLVYQRIVRSTWAALNGTALALGGTYRISVDAVGSATGAGVATALEELGAIGAVYWPGDGYPTDWPTDDRAPGRCRVQALLPTSMVGSVGGYLYFPAGAHFRAWRLRGA
jgi:hypothetical protein